MLFSYVAVFLSALLWALKNFNSLKIYWKWSVLRFLHNASYLWASVQSEYSIVEFILESRYFIGHFLKVMMCDVKGAVWIIFDINVKDSILKYDLILLLFLWTNLISIWYKGSDHCNLRLLRILLKAPETEIISIIGFSFV